MIIKLRQKKQAATNLRKKAERQLQQVRSLERRSSSGLNSIDRKIESEKEDATDVSGVFFLEAILGHVSGVFFWMPFWDIFDREFVVCNAGISLKIKIQLFFLLHRREGVLQDEERDK